MIAALAAEIFTVRDSKSLARRHERHQGESGDLLYVCRALMRIELAKPK